MRRVRVTELSGLSFCEKQVALSWQFKGETSYAQALGTAEHVRLAGQQRHGARPNWAGAGNQNPVLSAPVRVSRCYLVSHLYGENSPEVRRAQQFRDGFLLASPFRAWLVPCYYHIMPWLVKRRWSQWNEVRWLSDKLIMACLHSWSREWPED